MPARTRFDHRDARVKVMGFALKARKFRLRLFQRLRFMQPLAFDVGHLIRADDQGIFICKAISETLGFTGSVPVPARPR